MEPMEREDSSTYVNQQPQKTEVHEEPRPVTPAEPPKKKKGKAALILSLLLLLALLAAAAFAWLWYQKSGEVDNVRADLSSTRNKVAQLESAAKAEAALDEPSVTTDTKDDDSDAAVKAALAYEKAPVSAQNTTVELTLAKTSGNFARVESQSTDGTKKMYLKKSNDVWVVIVPLSLVAPSQQTIQQYGIPAEVMQ